MIWMLVILSFVGNGEPRMRYDKRIFPTEAACEAAASAYTGPRWDASHTFWRCTPWNRQANPGIGNPF